MPCTKSLGLWTGVSSNPHSAPPERAAEDAHGDGVRCHPDLHLVVVAISQLHGRLVTHLTDARGDALESVRRRCAAVGRRSRLLAYLLRRW